MGSDEPFQLCRGCYEPWPECGDLCDACAGILRDDLAEDDGSNNRGSDS